MDQHTRIVDMVGQLDLPNPTIPVPFERFAQLGNSDDMLMRAAFWIYYAAWMSDKHDTRPETAVQARHDAYILHAIAKQLTLRDCVMVRNDDLLALQQEAQGTDLRTRGHGVLLWALMSVAFATGALIMGVLRGI